MEQTLKTTPKDFFLHLLSNIGLYYSAAWLVALLYDYIDYSLGTFNSYEIGWLPGSMRWAIASLVIVFPVYIWITRRINKDMDANPEKRESRVRRWMMYLTLSLASIALIVDLVALIYQFLSGEFAITFFLKVLAVALVAGMIFAYYLYELRREAGRSAPDRAVFRYGAITIVLASVIGGFFIVGSPSEARKRQYDSQRITDLQNVQWQIVNYWQQKGALPEELPDLNDSISGYRVPADPETNAAYIYRPNSATRSFDLCAMFSRAASDPTGRPMPEIDDSKFNGSNWAHTEGEQCFSRTIDQDLYPIAPKRILN